jgi:hypothetical protein
MSSQEAPSLQAAPPFLDSLSQLAARSFATTPALVDAILRMITNQLGFRTSFLTHITSAENRNNVLAAHNLPDGCDIAPDVELPLEDTF